MNKNLITVLYINIAFTPSQKDPESEEPESEKAAKPE
jgi:hypothetical protein